MCNESWIYEELLLNNIYVMKANIYEELLLNNRCVMKTEYM